MQLHYVPVAPFLVEGDPHFPLAGARLGGVLGPAVGGLADHHVTAIAATPEPDKTFLRFDGFLKALPGGKQSVDAKIRAEASVLDTALDPIPALTRKVTITSAYKIGDIDTVHVAQQENTALLAEQKAREIDKAADVQLSTRHRGRQQTFDAGMYDDIERGISTHGSLDATVRKLQEFKGFGDRSAAVLKKAFGQAFAQGGGGKPLTLAEDERGVFTRIANLWDDGLGDML